MASALHRLPLQLAEDVFALLEELRDRLA